MVSDADLDAQISYYRAIATEYGEHTIDAPGGTALRTAFERFDVRGDVIELACGPGTWTRRLADRARSVTAVDASPEMLELARRSVGAHEVDFIQANLFDWRPPRRFDVVFFGFWLSHVPLERLASFWQTVDDALTPSGLVCFVDDAHRSADELVHGPDAELIERRLLDGTRHRAVKVEHQPPDLADRLHRLGWAIEVEGDGPFYWGSGGRRGDTQPLRR